MSRGHVDLHIAILAADHAGVVGKLVVGVEAVICAFVFFELDVSPLLPPFFTVRPSGGRKNDDSLAPDIYRQSNRQN